MENSRANRNKEVTEKKIPSEALIDLRRRLDSLPLRSPERLELVLKTAQTYGAAQATLYRYLNKHTKHRSTQRSDRGKPRKLAQEQMEYYCELIAAVKVRTSNKKGRHLSTEQAIYLLENRGIYTPDGLVKIPKSLLKKSTVNHYLKKWGYNYKGLFRQPPAVRFQANHSNECWQFDLSPSDLKRIKKPSWSREGKGSPTLMLYSIVDDRSGVAYMEYHCTYGEDVETALRFLFNAMASKKDEEFPFQGIPQMIYTDNGPIRKSHIFQQVMGYLEVNVKSHMPQGKDGCRQTARSKGKVERPFRTVKEMLETLYHLREPETEKEANVGLFQFLMRYNSMQHRLEPHSRIDDWLQNTPKSGVRKMCSWDRFCTFAREKEERKVASDARVSVDGIYYEVEPDLAGETVTFWWGLFDNELFVEHDGKKYGPYAPVGAPIPIHKYRKFKKTKYEERFSRIEALAEKLRLPDDTANTSFDIPNNSILLQDFIDPDPFQEYSFRNAIEAKKEISSYLGMPLAKLTAQQLHEIDRVLAETLIKKEVMEQIRRLFPLNKGKYNV